MSNKGDRAAFPDGTYTSSGMTQRQYYKAQALAGLMANNTVVCAADLTEGFNCEDVAEFCGTLADAMIAEDAQHAKAL